MTLNITNGDWAITVLKDAGIDGEFVAWKDFLHEGPVPAGRDLESLRSVRASYIASCGMAPYEEVLRDFEERDATLERNAADGNVVLWFEHDLYDQLQLLQLLDWFAGCSPLQCAVELVQADSYLGNMSAADIAAASSRRRLVSSEELTIAHAAWVAFTGSDPADLVDFAHREMPALPHLAPALRRLIEEYPDSARGLSRTEAQIIHALENGPLSLRELYHEAHTAAEERLFMGDTLFAFHAARLSRVEHPLLQNPQGTPLTFPADDPGYWQAEVELAPAGTRILTGADHIALNGIDRWIGGVHLRRNDLWRRTGTRLSHTTR